MSSGPFTLDVGSANCSARGPRCSRETGGRLLRRREALELIEPVQDEPELAAVRSSPVRRGVGLACPPGLT